MKRSSFLLLFFVIILGLTFVGCTHMRKTLRSEAAREVRLENILLERALEYEQRGEPHKALQNYEAALAVVAGKKGGLEASLRRDAKKHYRRGLKFKEQGKYAKARHEFIVALRLWPDFPEAVALVKPARSLSSTRDLVHKVKVGECLTAIAKKYYNDQKQYECIARYNSLKDPGKLYPGMEIRIPEIEGVSFHSDARHQVTRPSPRETVFERSEAESNHQGMWQQPAQSDAAVSYPLVADEPTVALEEEVEYDPVAIYQEQGVSLLDNGQYLAALHEFQKVLNTDPGKKRAREFMSLAHYRQGEVLFEQADYLEARRHFQHALSLDEQCTSCIEYVKRAEDAYKEAHYLNGIKHFEEQRLKEAIEEWQLVGKLDSQYKQVRNYLLRAQGLLDKVQELKQVP